MSRIKGLTYLKKGAVGFREDREIENGSPQCSRLPSSILRQGPRVAIEVSQEIRAVTLAAIVRQNGNRSDGHCACADCNSYPFQVQDSLLQRQIRRTGSIRST
jgi:hypothetical protein